MKQIAIVGAGGLGREVAMLLEQINAAVPTWEVMGFYDDGIPAGTLVNGYACRGNVSALNQVQEALAVVVAIGMPAIKARIVEQLQNTAVYFPVLIHPSVQMANRTHLEIGEGSIITANCVLTVNIKLGKHVLLSIGSLVSHDAVLGDYTAVMPGVNISGGVTVGEGCYIGAGATIINHIEVGSNTTVGAGAVVVKSLPASCTAVGVPARPIKMHAS
ncbi:acetyltransferase [Pontibacter sp. CAU 1760]